MSISGLNCTPYLHFLSIITSFLLIIVLHLLNHMAPSHLFHLFTHSFIQMPVLVHTHTLNLLHPTIPSYKAQSLGILSQSKSFWGTTYHAPQPPLSMHGNTHARTHTRTQADNYTKAVPTGCRHRHCFHNSLSNSSVPRETLQNSERENKEQEKEWPWGKQWKMKGKKKFTTWVKKHTGGQHKKERLWTEWKGT